ncbi:MAG: hypothetical protein PVF37_06530, partial [Desulfobacterales bacterium]
MKSILSQTLIKAIDTVRVAVRHTWGRLHDILTMNVYIGRNIKYLSGRSITFFPLQDNTFCCGIAAIVSYKARKSTAPRPKIGELEDQFVRIEQSGWDACNKLNDVDLAKTYLGGKSHLDSLWQAIQNLKCIEPFYSIYKDPNQRSKLSALEYRLTT